jgi:predicted nucleic acid-binding protein
MAASVLVDSGFLVALLNHRDSNSRWATTTARQYPPPWLACEAAISESFYLLGDLGILSLIAFLRREEVTCPFQFRDHVTEVLNLMQKYADVPMSFADACLVRMTEVLPDPLLLTTDADFRIYKRHGRQVVPCVMPD